MTQTCRFRSSVERLYCGQGTEAMLHGGNLFEADASLRSIFYQHCRREKTLVQINTHTTNPNPQPEFEENLESKN
jgi:hypothetical protein